jgi:phosphate/sulfate permease
MQKQVKKSELASFMRIIGVVGAIIGFFLGIMTATNFYDWGHPGMVVFLEFLQPTAIGAVIGIAFFWMSKHLDNQAEIMQMLSGDCQKKSSSGEE